MTTLVCFKVSGREMEGLDHGGGAGGRACSKNPLMGLRYVFQSADLVLFMASSPIDFFTDKSLRCNSSNGSFPNR